MPYQVSHVDHRLTDRCLVTASLSTFQDFRAALHMRDGPSGVVRGEMTLVRTTNQQPAELSPDLVCHTRNDIYLDALRSKYIEIISPYTHEVVFLYPDFCSLL